MIVVCKKEYKGIKVGDLVDILPRSENSLTDPDLDERNCKFPIAGIYLPDIGSVKLIYYVEYEEHFCSISEYRKMKLDRLNS